MDYVDECFQHVPLDATSLTRCYVEVVNMVVVNENVTFKNCCCTSLYSRGKEPTGLLVLNLSDLLEVSSPPSLLYKYCTVLHLQGEKFREISSLSRIFKLSVSDSATVVLPDCNTADFHVESLTHITLYKSNVKVVTFHINNVFGLSVVDVICSNVNMVIFNKYKRSRVKLFFSCSTIEAVYFLNSDVTLLTIKLLHKAKVGKLYFNTSIVKMSDLNKYYKKNKDGGYERIHK